MAAAVSRTCGLWIRNLTLNPCPGPAAVASTCLRTNLPWLATPRALHGDKGSHSEFMAVFTENTVEDGRGGDTYLPCSAICPLLTTRIWSAPIIVDNL